MITQKFKNGVSEIRIESAESKADAGVHGFPDGVYSRYFIDDKPIDSYMAVVNYIVESTRAGGNYVVPTDTELRELQKDLMEKQKQSFQVQIDQLKKQYGSSPVPEGFLDQFDKMLDAMDLNGVRVQE